MLQQAKVFETVAALNTMGDMIHLDGVTLLFPTSFGYFDPYVIKTAKANRKVIVMHCGGLWKQG